MMIHYYNILWPQSWIFNQYKHKYYYRPLSLMVGSFESKAFMCKNLSVLFGQRVRSKLL